MKLIEAMKKLKSLNVKCADLRELVSKHCADMTHENPVYGTAEKQRAQVDEWVQSHTDTVTEIARLRVAITRTNLQTQVTMEIGGNNISKSIAEWIHWRKDLAGLQLFLWQQFGDRGLRDGFLPSTSQEKVPTTVRRYFEPAKRDQMLSMYKTEPTTIDGYLEVANAVTELIEG